MFKYLLDRLVQTNDIEQYINILFTGYCNLIKMIKPDSFLFDCNIIVDDI